MILSGLLSRAVTEKKNVVEQFFFVLSVSVCAVGNARQMKFNRYECECAISLYFTNLRR